MSKKKAPSRKQQMAALSRTIQDTTADLLDLVKEEMNSSKLDFDKWETLFTQQCELEYTLTGEGPVNYSRDEFREEYERYCRRFKPKLANISATCEDEYCTQCREPAGHKIGEEIPFDDPRTNEHNLTAYICCKHFKRLMGVDQCVHEEAR